VLNLRMRWGSTLFCTALILGVWRATSQADSPEARALVAEGQMLAEAGQLQLALDSLERAIRSDIDCLPAYEAALPLWLALGQQHIARARLEALTLRCPDCVFAWYALGALYRKDARYDLAILAYEAYLARRPKDPDAHFGLAMALAATGDSRARAALQRYLRLETRAERAAFRRQAETRLAALGEETANARPTEPDLQPRPVSGIELLLEQGQVSSAEALLDEAGWTDARAVGWRAEIARRRGQWFHELGFRGLLRIYQL
jgi:tetratricopeptide (TPR) repeat protein